MNPAAIGHYEESTVAGETVRAYVPAALPPNVSAKTLKELQFELDAAEAALEKLDLAAAMVPSVDWFIYAFVRKEALLSSEIEGTRATLEDVLSYEQTQRSGSSSVEDVKEVSRYVHAVEHALNAMHARNELPLSLRLLHECHQILMEGARGGDRQPGEIRRSQNWIGGTRPGDSVFVPPPPHRVPELLADLETYWHADDRTPALLRVAAAHVQFETIHPYLDGNGRVGRMLIALLLDHWRKLRSPLLYLSVYLRRHRDAYYGHLNTVRQTGDWAGWFRFFLAGVAETSADAVSTASALHRRVGEDRSRLLAQEGVTLTAVQLFERLPEHPVLSVPAVTRLLSTTKPTAGKAIEVLKEAGILTEVGERKRDRLFRYEAYLALLE